MGYSRGIVEPRETIEEAIYREVGQETGLTIQVRYVIYAYANRDQFPSRQTFQTVYLCKYKGGELRLDPLEHDMYQWLDYNNISTIDTIDFLRELVKSYLPSTI